MRGDAEDLGPLGQQADAIDTDALAEARGFGSDCSLGRPDAQWKTSPPFTSSA